MAVESNVITAEPGFVHAGYPTLGYRERADGGGTVFNTGCTDWALGLANNDPAVLRITKNVLEKLGFGGAVPAAAATL